MADKPPAAAPAAAPHPQRYDAKRDAGKGNLGLIGLAVMGENLVLNFASHGFAVSVYNRTTSKVDDFLNARAKGKKIIGTHSLEELVGSLEKPAKIMLMVQAGKAVDAVIGQLIPLLARGDIIIDGGNSNYPDTERRTKELSTKGLLFIGTGVSGGEEGALLGPSIMPGGHPDAWLPVKPLFQAIAAKVEGGVPCCDWVGSGGAGHYVKTVHNGIEYGDIQLICEAYHFLKTVLKLGNEELREIFDNWNKGDLDSYLIEITRDILGKREEEKKDQYVVDNILDVAGQKGTGKWTAISALDLGMPVSLIAEAVFARCLSAQKDERVRAAAILEGPEEEDYKGDKKALVEAVRDALFASKLVSYAQGFVLMKAASDEHKWNINFGSVALMWRGGCIIRSAFLGKIKDAFQKTENKLENLLLDDYFQKKTKACQKGWRKVVAEAAIRGIPIPAISSALNYFDGYRSVRLPANLLQAQRDYFGAHQYERVDQPRGQFFHTNWTGRGGVTASSAYSV
jgi:6-phosphogluconate dehydrogenase